MQTPFPVEYRWRWVPNATFSRWARTFHVVYVNFICIGHPTQTRFSVEYGLNTSLGPKYPPPQGNQSSHPEPFTALPCRTSSPGQDFWPNECFVFQHTPNRAPLNRQAGDANSLIQENGASRKFEELGFHTWNWVSTCLETRSELF